MAKWEISGLDELSKVIEKLGADAPAKCERAVQAGAKVLIEAAERTVPVRTGALRSHIKAGKISHDAINGYYCEVYPDGIKPGKGKRDSRRYATIGFVLEYGCSNMRARPWMRTAVESSEKQVQQAMADEIMKDM